MKAITCTQCGALIKRIMVRDKFALCDYCGAKILFEETREKPAERPARTENSGSEKNLTPYEQYLKKRQENAAKYAVMADVYHDPEPVATSFGPKTGVLIILLLAAIPLVVLYFAAQKSRPAASPQEVSPAQSQSTPSRAVVSTPTFYPGVNYQVSVRWSGSNDMEHFEHPQIDPAKLPTFDEKELKKTVFANRRVEVKVTINESGEVSEARAVSGHPVLKEAAETAARKTLFASRSKPVSRMLTYIFRLRDG